MRRKRGYNILLALTLVLAVSAALWFTAPVSALDISFPSLPSPQPPGSSHSFTVNITISDTELLPIQSIDLEIYNASNPSYTANMTDLPLVSGVTKSAGTISITNTTVNNWYYGYGYGYAVWEGTPYYLGYGYGYGYGIGAASILYVVTWASPSNWPAGTYKVKMTITANSTTFTKTGGDFVLTAPPEPPPSGGGGGGGGGFEAPPGIKYVSDYVGTSGIFIMDITTDSEDGKAVLFIPKGTKGNTKQGEPLWQITMFEELEPSAFPTGANGIGPVYDIGPEGCIFETPITLTITYDQADVTVGVDETDMVIAMWDYDAGKWVVIDGTVIDPDANTITAPITRFTDYAILTYTFAAASFTTDDLTISPTEVDIGEPITISVLVTNTGGSSGGYTVILRIDDVLVASQYVTVAADSSQMVTFTDIPTDVAGSYTVTIDELSGTLTVKTALVPPPTPAPAFTTSTLTISPAEVKTGEPVTISVLVTNTGDAAGTYTATLKIDNTVVVTKDMTLAAGSSHMVTFTDVPTDVAGSYTVTIDELSGTLTVKSLINWWLIGIIIAVGIIVGVIISQVIRRRWA